MLSPRNIILEIVCPAFGTILANLMFSAPYKDAKNAVNRGFLGDLNPTPWAFMLGNCCGWVTYGILNRNLWIFFANAPGFVLSVWLNLAAAKLQYEGHIATEMRKSFADYLEKSQREYQQSSSLRPLSVDTENPKQPTDDDGPIQRAMDFGKVVWDVTSQNSPAPAPHEQITLIIVVIWLAVISLICLADVDKHTKDLIVGCVVNLNLVFFYGAPLSTIFTVLKTRNSASIHIRTMITNTANGAFWTAYGLAVLDPFVYATNGVGACLGVVQMFLVFAFPRNTPLKETENSQVREKMTSKTDATTLENLVGDLKKDSADSDSSPIRTELDSIRRHSEHSVDEEISA